MLCPACGGEMRQIPAVYPTFHCKVCGTLVHGSEEDREEVMPSLLKKIMDSGDCIVVDVQARARRGV